MVNYLQSGERSFLYVPRVVFVSLALALCMQVVLHASSSDRSGEFRQLPPAPPLSQARIMSFSDPVFLGRVTMLWLQSFDTQPGISVSFKQLDYEKLVQWLELVLKLDPPGQYPLLSASRIYAEVADEKRQRIMLDFVYDQFQQDPDRRWPAMAHAVFIARHRLHDMELALHYARAMARNVAPEAAPHWVRQMHIYVLEDMGKLESAMVLIGGLLESGQITDERELQFLHQRLDLLREEINQEEK